MNAPSDFTVKLQPLESKLVQTKYIMVLLCIVASIQLHLLFASQVVFVLILAQNYLVPHRAMNVLQDHLNLRNVYRGQHAWLLENRVQHRSIAKMVYNINAAKDIIVPWEWLI